MRISEEKIQEVLTKADIVSVVSKYTNLQKHGQDYVGLCLFHQDNSPSMHVSPVKKIFKCFSCGVGGNAIDFLMKYKHLPFLEAISELASEFNVDLGTITFQPKKEKYSEAEKTIFAINQEASKYYQVNLNASLGTQAKAYLTNRQINEHQIQQWEIGFAVGDEIVKHLLGLGYSEKQIVAAGLATKKDNGVFDYFVNRIVFPIKNQDGYITGFSGRILTDEKPKYLNTRETLVFKKANILFNLDRLWAVKERLDSIIVLEGFMDVISLEKIGVNNAVALMGTAFSSFHLQTFKDLKKPLKLFLDGDEAGVNAMYKIAETLIKNNMKFLIIDNNSNKDPDELVTSGQTENLLKMINQPINPYEYFLEKLVANKANLSFDEINQISGKIITLLKYETNYILIDKVTNLLSTKLGISKAAIEKTLDQSSAQRAPSVQTPSKKIANHKLDKYDLGRNRIFVSLLKSDEFLKQTEPFVPQISGNFSYEKMFNKLIGFYQTNQYQGNNLKQFFNLVKRESFTNEEVELMMSMIEHPLNGFENYNKLSEEEFVDIINKFKIKDLEQQISAIRKIVNELDLEINAIIDPNKKEILKQKRANSISRSQKLSEHKRELSKEKE